ncbi:ABC transporter ATP-binding protein [Candidatus Riflebacteria bacterium]
MATVEFDKITKAYEGSTSLTLHETSFKIEDKEFVVLVGPSGCGKSTTLRLISGLEDITSGELKIDDKVVNLLPPKDRDIAMVFQNYALYPHMSVYDNMAFGLKLRHYPKKDIDERVKKAGDILDIAHLLDRKPKALSGGQRQRVALGRAIVREPKVFLMDEPLSNLDAKLRVGMRTEINKLHQRLGSTIVYVTHDQTEAMTMGDKIVVMNDGIIQQIAPPLKIYHEPTNKFVAGFIGSPPMNFVKSSISNKENAELQFLGRVFKLDSARKSILKDYQHNDIWVGIRPEFFTLPENSEEKDTFIFEITIQIVEPMGAESFVFFNLGDCQFTARFPPLSKFVPGLKLKVGIDPRLIHLFDSKTEERLVTA